MSKYISKILLLMIVCAYAPITDEAGVALAPNPACIASEKLSLLKKECTKEGFTPEQITNLNGQSTIREVLDKYIEYAGVNCVNLLSRLEKSHMCRDDLKYYIEKTLRSSAPPN